MPRPKWLTPEQQTLPEAIRRVAWKHIAAEGAQSLRLRAIARDLGVTAPAIYNYFPDRDALVTALLIEAYTSFAEALETARDQSPAADLPRRFMAIGLAYRQWALDFPQRYQLVFGTPLPGYAAPMEVVQPHAARALAVIVSVLEALRLQGLLRLEDIPAPPAGFEIPFAYWQHLGTRAEMVSLSASLIVWGQVHGLVALEIGGNYPAFGPSGEALYRYTLNALTRQFITPPAQN